MSVTGDISNQWSAAEPNVVVVATGEFAVAEDPAWLLTPALGSCVGVAVWDATRRRGGLAHVMLPAPASARVSGRAERFASIAVPRLVQAVSNGAPARRLVAKIAGGSAMFGRESESETIGHRNVVEVRHQLELLHVPLVAEDTGGTHARTMELHPESGLVVVRSYRYGIKEL
jgi:chemotaxis protein CheD